MGLKRTVDGFFAAPVTASTTADASRRRELAADVFAKVPELMQFLDFGTNAAAGSGHTGWSAHGSQYHVNPGTWGGGTTGSWIK